LESEEWEVSQVLVPRDVVFVRVVNVSLDIVV
jgi:hypothetical protein